MMDLVQAIKRPFQKIVRTILCSVLLAIPIINFFSLGYLLEVARSVWDGSEEIPRWENWGTLWVHGFFVFLLTIIYAVPYLLLLILGTVFDAARLIMIILMGLYTLFFIPTLMSSLLTYARNFSMNESLVFIDVIKRAFTKSFIIAVLLSIVWTAILFIPQFIPIVGFLWMLILGYGLIYIVWFLFTAEEYEQFGAATAKPITSLETPQEITHHSIRHNKGVGNNNHAKTGYKVHKSTRNKKRHKSK